MNFSVLVTAFSINPFQEGEDALAWEVIKMLDQKFNIILITRHKNRPAIEKWLSESANSVSVQAQFHYFDLPFSKRLRGKSILYSYLWHLQVVAFIRRNRFEFDISHQLHMGKSCPTPFLWKFNRPFIWGPVRLPYPTDIPAEKFSLSNHIWKVICFLRRNLDPFFKISKKKAAHIFACDEEVVTTWGLSGNKVSLVEVKSPSEKVQIMAKTYWLIFQKQAIQHFGISGRSVQEKAS